MPASQDDGGDQRGRGSASGRRQARSGRGEGSTGSAPRPQDGQGQRTSSAGSRAPDRGSPRRAGGDRVGPSAAGDDRRRRPASGDALREGAGGRDRERLKPGAAAGGRGRAAGAATGEARSAGGERRPDDRETTTDRRAPTDRRATTDRRARAGRQGGEGSRPSDGSRGRAADRPEDPELPEEVVAEALDRSARDRLRTLSRDNADRVARHLVAAGLLLDRDPERAYAHAQAAHRRGGRVDVVREALGLTAYATGRYAEALRELRAARRLSGLDEHRAIEADCERGLGRPERALALAVAPGSAALSPTERVELAIVASGARLDLGEPDAALAALESPEVVSVRDPEIVQRVAEAKVEVLVALGRGEEAAGLAAAAPQPAEEVVVVMDWDDVEVVDGDDQREAPSGAEDEGDVR